MFIEYALILAFVVAAGIVFVGNSSLADSITGIFSSTNETLSKASNSTSSESKENRFADSVMSMIASGTIGLERFAGEWTLNSYVSTKYPSSKSWALREKLAAAGDELSIANEPPSYTQRGNPAIEWAISQNGNTYILYTHEGSVQDSSYIGTTVKGNKYVYTVDTSGKSYTLVSADYNTDINVRLGPSNNNWAYSMLGN